MISIFIFPAESAVCGEMDGLGGLTRFRQEGVFRCSDRSASRNSVIPSEVEFDSVEDDEGPF